VTPDDHGMFEVPGSRLRELGERERRLAYLRGVVAAIFDDPPLHGPGQCDECDERWQALRKAAG
jgi:hypothetical protein